MADLESEQLDTISRKELCAVLISTTPPNDVKMVTSFHKDSLLHGTSLSSSQADCQHSFSTI